MIKGFERIKDVYIKLSVVLTEKQKKKSIGLIIMILIGALFEMAGVSIIVPLIQVILAPDSLLADPEVSSILKMLGVDDAKGVVLFVGTGTIILYIVKNIYMTFLSWRRVNFAAGVQQELSVNMLNAYMNKGYVYFLNVNTGDVQRGIQNDAEGVYQVLLQGMRIMTEMFSVVCICILIIIVDWKMAFCIMSFAMIGFLIVSFTCRRYLQKIGKEYQLYTGIVNGSLIQIIQGMKEITIMHCKEYFASKYKKAFGKRQKVVVGQVVAAESPAFLIEAVCVCGMILVVCISALQNSETTRFISGLGAFAIAAFRILPSTGKITNYLNNFLFYYPSLDSAYENMISLSKEIMGSAPNEKYIEEMEEKPAFNMSLVLKNIVWKYPESNHNVLDGLNLEIKKGTSVGLIGASGAGKTTVSDIILGLFEPQKGEILLDGKNIMKISNQWHKIIGYVPQNIFLIDDTVRNNVAFGVEQEKIRDDKVWHALEQAQMKEFVESLTEGLDTQVGDRGIRFSGGQRQRLAIARALYNDPDVLVLDEATSALDTETESAVMEAIDILHKHKTLIIVAHRLSTIQNCDVVYEIVDGKAVKQESKENDGTVKC